MRLFADAQFYSLPRLISQLYEESIFMSIGHREFQIPRDLFSDPGNTPNFFSLGFAIFFSNRDEIFPGLNRQGLIRPPSILPPSVPGRSADTFAELLHLLRGYPVHIRDDEHRASLLRDCRYFNFKGLEQRLIPHAITFNQARRRDEIALRLEDILKSGISVLPDPLLVAGQPGADPAAGWVNYARPFVDEKPAELVLEIGGENMRLHFGVVTKIHTPLTATTNNGGPSSSSSDSGTTLPTTRVEFFRDVRTRITKLFEVIASKLNLPPTTQPLGLLMAAGGASSQPATPGNTPLSEDDWVRCVLEPETSIMLDGKPYTGHHHYPLNHPHSGHSSLPTATAAATSTAPSSSSSSYYINQPFMDDYHQDRDGNHPMSGISIGGGLHHSGSGPAGLDSPTGFSGLSLNAATGPNAPPPPRKRRRTDGFGGDGGGGGNGAQPGGDGQAYWTIKTGQWRLRIQSAKHGRSSVECFLYAVKLDAMSGELARNEMRGFLKG